MAKMIFEPRCLRQAFHVVKTEPTLRCAQRAMRITVAMPPKPLEKLLAFILPRFWLPEASQCRPVFPT